MVYLTLAFVALWLLVTGYLVFMSRTQNSLEKDVRLLEETMAESSSTGTPQ